MKKIEGVVRASGEQISKEIKDMTIAELCAARTEMSRVHGLLTNELISRPVEKSKKEGRNEN